jgi:hypothetical protein
MLSIHMKTNSMDHFAVRPRRGQLLGPNQDLSQSIKLSGSYLIIDSMKN